MYHVSTMLPYVATDEQKLERKRHLGNDVAMIVYKEGNQKFDPTCIHSMFNHIFIVVQKDDNSDKYRFDINHLFLSFSFKYLFFFLSELKFHIKEIFLILLFL